MDSNVLAFAPAGNGSALVEGTDTKLWIEAPGWQANNSRTFLDQYVIAFASAGNGDTLVEGNDTKLWLEAPGWQATNSRIFLDSNVMAFSTAGIGNYFVEGANTNLWLEAPGWQANNNRTYIDDAVMSFSPAGNEQVFVQGSNENLWLESPGWQANNSRTFMDANVMSVAANTVEPNGLAFGYVGSIPLADPTAGAGYSPAPAGAPLFNNNQPSYLDVEQGVAADCWLMASLAEVVDRDPQIIKSMFVPDGTTVDNGATVSVYLVRFYSTSGAPFYIKVDTELPGGGEFYDHVNTALGTQALWAALAEKGYAEANAFGLVVTNSDYQDSYGALNFGDPVWALHAITGDPANDYGINPSNVVSAWNSGQLVVLDTPNSSPPSPYIVSDHSYAMVGYDASSSNPFEVFNPWGTQVNGWAPGHTNTIYGLFTAPAAFIAANFSSQSIGTRATNADVVMDPFDELAVTAILDQATPRKIALVYGNGNDNDNDNDNGNDNMALSYTQPASITATGSKPIPW